MAEKGVNSEKEPLWKKRGLCNDKKTTTSPNIKETLNETQFSISHHHKTSFNTASLI